DESRVSDRGTAIERADAELRVDHLARRAPANLALESNAQLVTHADTALALLFLERAFADRDVDSRKGLACQVAQVRRAIRDLGPALRCLVADVLHADVERVVDPSTARRDAAAIVQENAP